MKPIKVAVPFPTMETAIKAIERFAADNKMRGEELVEVLQAGIFAHCGFLIEEEDRKPHWVQQGIVVEKALVTVGFSEL